MKRLLVLFILTIFATQLAAAKPVGIKAKDAWRRVGDRTSVCGTIVDSSFLEGSGREPTFLNFGDTYPKHPFTAVIWGESRDQFDYAPETLKGKNICVSGIISTYRGKPQMIIESPKQILEY